MLEMEKLNVCRSQWWLLIAALCLAATALATPAAGQTVHDVGVGPGSGFVPADITIDVGDTVRWTWIRGFHNVESGVGSVHDDNFRSGDPVENNGLTFEVTFDQAFLDKNPMPGNMYPYYCSVHIIFGMTGTVTVKAAPPACPSDFNDDQIVNVLDLLALLSDWGPCDDPDDCASDLNDDDTVNVLDMLALLSEWGECPK